MTRAGVIKRLALVTAVLFLALSYVAFDDLGSRPGASLLLDLRPLGYDSPQAERFVALLSYEAKQAYRGVYLILDTVFIGFLTALVLTIAGGLRPRRFWQVVAAFGLLYAAADIAENSLVARIVQGDLWRVELASLMTRVKFASLLLAAAAMITSWRQEQT